jgi:hypothetical protein
MNGEACPVGYYPIEGNTAYCKLTEQPCVEDAGGVCYAREEIEAEQEKECKQCLSRT